MGRDWDGLVMLKEGVQSKKIKLFIFTAGRSASGWKFSAQENVNVITSTQKMYKHIRNIQANLFIFVEQCI